MSADPRQSEQRPSFLERVGQTPVVVCVVDAGALGAFVAGVGTGGTLMGVGQALRAAMPWVNLFAVEPAESAVMSGGEPGEHGIMGIGDGFIPELLDMGEIDGVELVSTEEARDEAGRLRRAHGSDARDGWARAASMSQYPFAVRSTL